MSAVQQQRSPVLPAAAAFVAMGGRIMLSPKGKLETAMDVRVLFDPDSLPEATTAAHSAAKAMLAHVTNPRSVSSLKRLVLRTGERTPNGWLIVEAG